MGIVDLFLDFWIPSRTTIDGFTVITDRRLPIHMRRKIYLGRYEAAERAAARASVGPEDRVLEIGTAVGVVGLLCAKRSGGNTLHYEPNPATQEIIKENFALNGMTCNLRQKAVTARGGEVTFGLADNIWSSSLLPRNLERQLKVQSDAIDDVIAEFRPTVIVMDVEGAELEIIEAGELKGVKTIIYESHPALIGEEGEQRIRTRLTALGFDLIFRGGGRTKSCLTYTRRQTAPGSNGMAKAAAAAS